MGLPKCCALRVCLGLAITGRSNGVGTVLELESLIKGSTGREVRIPVPLGEMTSPGVCCALVPVTQPGTITKKLHSLPPVPIRLECTWTVLLAVCRFIASLTLTQ